MSAEKRDTERPPRPEGDRETERRAAAWVQDYEWETRSRLHPESESTRQRLERLERVRAFRARVRAHREAR